MPQSFLPPQSGFVVGGLALTGLVVLGLVLFGGLRDEDIGTLVASVSAACSRGIFVVPMIARCSAAACTRWCAALRR